MKKLRNLSLGTASLESYPRFWVFATLSLLFHLFYLNGGSNDLSASILLHSAKSFSLWGVLLYRGLDNLDKDSLSWIGLLILSCPLHNCIPNKSSIYMRIRLFYYAFFLPFLYFSGLSRFGVQSRLHEYAHYV